jgi:uncharacterized protein (DUF305 family)
VGPLKVVLALTAALLLVGCGRGTPAESPAPSFNASDVRFLQDMIGHHQQAIQMATLADGRSRRPRLIRFAAGIAATRQADIATMRRWLTQWNLPTAPATGSEDAESPLPGMLAAGQLEWLELRTGLQFDLGFLTMMDTHYGGAITVAERELQAGASAETKALARRIITTQTAEMRQLHRWKDAWSADTGQPSSG